MVNFKVRRLYRYRIYKAVFAALLILGLVLVVPGSFYKFVAAPLEDCDLDGYDDATGVPVPWPGYDETKGDTPDGPAGSKTPEVTTTPAVAPTSAASASDSKDSNATGSTSAKAENGNSKSTDSKKSVKNSKSQSIKNESDKASTSGVKPNSTTAAGAGKNTGKVTEKVVNSSQNISASASSSAQNNTQKEEQDKSVKTIGVEKETNKNSGVDAASGNTEKPVPVVDNSQEAEAQSTENQPQVTVENPEISPDTATEIIEAINTKGSLNITEAAGSIIHAGSSIIISGSGFYKDLKNLEIVIQSEPRQLGVVESTQEGSFKAQFEIPKDLTEGTHHIVVLYQGKEITRQEIVIGPKAADSFWEALTVGFTSDNQGLIPGILILTGLLILGAIVLGGNMLAGTFKRREESI